MEEKGSSIYFKGTILFIKKNYKAHIWHGYMLIIYVCASNMSNNKKGGAG